MTPVDIHYWHENNTIFSCFLSKKRDVETGFYNTLLTVASEFTKDLDEVITAKIMQTTKLISRAISQSEARTQVFTVSQQNDSVLQNAKTYKSV